MAEGRTCTLHTGTVACRRDPVRPKSVGNRGSAEMRAALAERARRAASGAASALRAKGHPASECLGAERVPAGAGGSVPAVLRRGWRKCCDV